MLTAEKLKSYIANPSKIILYLNYYRIGHLFSDKFLLKTLFKLRMGKKLDLKHPETFNEKLQWLKLYDRNPQYTQMVDKYEAKKYVADKIGAEYVIPSIGIWNEYEEIDFAHLPEQFVIKCTHNSGGVVVCRDKSKMDFGIYREKFNEILKRNYFWSSREWPYKNVKPRIMAERFVSDGVHENLIVYKVLCFHGQPRIIQVIQDDKQPNESIDYFDTDWNLLELKQNFPNSIVHLQKPELLGEMLELSKKLSENIPFVRVDWYIANNRLLFSELTFYSDSGTAAFTPEKWDYTLGEWLSLPQRSARRLQKNP